MAYVAYFKSKAGAARSNNTATSRPVPVDGRENHQAQPTAPPVLKHSVASILALPLPEVVVQQVTIPIGQVSAPPQPPHPSREGFPFPFLLPGQPTLPPHQDIRWPAEMQGALDEQIEKNRKRDDVRRRSVIKKYQDHMFQFKCIIDFETATMEIEQSVIPRKYRKTREELPLTNETSAIKDLLRTGENEFKIVIEVGTLEVNWLATLFANRVVPTFPPPLPSPPPMIRKKRGRPRRTRPVTPLTADLYILGTVEHVPFVMNKDEEAEVPEIDERRPPRQQVPVKRPMDMQLVPVDNKMDSRSSTKPRRLRKPDNNLSVGVSNGESINTSQTSSASETERSTTQDVVAHQGSLRSAILLPITPLDIDDFVTQPTPAITSVGTEPTVSEHNFPVIARSSADPYPSASSGQRQQQHDAETKDTISRKATTPTTSHANRLEKLQEGKAVQLASSDQDGSSRTTATDPPHLSTLLYVEDSADSTKSQL